MNKNSHYTLNSKMIQHCALGIVILILSTLQTNILPSEASRLLLIPGLLYSNVNFFSSVGKALKEDGHDVYVLTLEKHGGLVEEYSLKPLLHSPPNTTKNGESRENILDILEGILAEGVREEVSTLSMYRFAMPVLSDFCKELNENRQLIEQLAKLNFDLSLNEGVFAYSCLYVLPYHLNLRYVTLTAQHDPWTHGVTAMPSVEPSHFLSTTNQMGFFERLINIIPFCIITLNPMSFLYSQEIVGEFAPNKPYQTIRELVAGSEMTLVNQEVLCVGYPRVSAPNYQFIGGVSVRPAHQLPEDLENFAASAQHGLIVLSLGSSKGLHAIWPQIRVKVFRALGRLPQGAILQYAPRDKEEINVPDNIKLVKWLPQNDLLGHRNTKVFITHGGNNGQQEAVYHGVPVLSMPFSGDQFLNAKRAEAHGYGLQLDYHTFTEEDMYHALRRLLLEPSFRERIRHCSSIVRSMPAPQKTAVFWINHILRFGGDHLRPTSSDMPLYKVFMLDVIAFLTVIFTLMSLLTCYCGIRIYHKCSNACRSSKKQKKQ